MSPHAPILLGGFLTFAGILSPGNFSFLYSGGGPGILEDYCAGLMKLLSAEVIETPMNFQSGPRIDRTPEKASLVADLLVHTVRKLAETVEAQP